MSDQPALFDRRLDKALEQRMRVERLALQLRVELNADEPGMVGPLDDLGERAVRAHSREDQAAFLERALVMDVDLVAVAVAFADAFGAVDRADVAVAVEH